MSTTSDDLSPVTGGRGLATATAVLRVLAYVRRHPEGVRADEVAAVAGKSISTAYHLLASLCDEGFAIHDGGLYRPAPEQTTTAPDSGLRRLEDAVDELFFLTHKRAYLAVVRPGAVEMVAVRGRQGVARMPGLGARIHDSAHATALGKIALSRQRPAALERYLAAGLRRFTRHTITDSRELLAELDRVRRDGYALDRQEFDADFCCVAAPVVGPAGELRAIVGLSATTPAFDTERDDLVRATQRVAQRASGREATPR